MKMLDVVNQLRLIIPKKTNLFSADIPVSSISALSGLVTFTTLENHSLSTGSAITVHGAKSETAISSVVQDGLLFTFGTSADHDLTLGWPDNDTVTLSGFTDPNWNGSFPLISTVNRRTFTVQSTNTLPVLNTAEKLLENKTTGINGQHSVTFVSSKIFTVSGTFADGDYLDASVSGSVRISGAVDIDRAIEQYTEQGISDYWMFVVMHDATVSKSRNADNDAVSTIPSGTSIRQRLIDGFSIFVVVNTSQQIAAEEAVDVCRNDLLLPILQSVFGAEFTTGLSGGADFKTIFTGHGINSYSKAVYVHQYDFETPMDLTDDDSVHPGETHAFRDIDYTHEINGSFAPDVEAIISLDEQPI